MNLVVLRRKSWSAAIRQLSLVISPVTPEVEPDRALAVCRGRGDKLPPDVGGGDFDIPAFGISLITLVIKSPALSNDELT